MGVKNQKFIKIPKFDEYIDELGAVRLEDGRVIVRTYEDQHKTVAWTSDTPLDDSTRLQKQEIIKVTAAHISAGELNLEYEVAHAGNVKIQQIGSISLVNASADEVFFADSSNSFLPDKPDFRATDQSDIISIRDTDLSTNIQEDDVLEVRYDIHTDELTKVRQIVDQVPVVELVEVTNTHVAQGYFVLSQLTSARNLIEIYHLGGIEQINRAAFTAAQLNYLPDLPDYDVADPNATEPKAIYIRSFDFSALNDSDLQTKISDKIVSGDLLVVHYRR